MYFSIPLFTIAPCNNLVTKKKKSNPRLKFLNTCLKSYYNITHNKATKMIICFSRRQDSVCLA